MRDELTWVECLVAQDSGCIHPDVYRMALRDTLAEIKRLQAALDGRADTEQ